MTASTSKKEASAEEKKKQYGKFGVVAVTAIVIIIVIAALFTIFGASAGQIARNNANTLTSNIPSNAPTTTTTGINAPTVQNYITQANATSVVGPGGVYVASAANATELQIYPPNYAITASTVVWYNITRGHTPGAVHEVVATSANAMFIYNSTFDQLNATFSANALQKGGAKNVSITTNGISNALTYSFVSYFISQGNLSGVGTLLIGTKHGHFVYFDSVQANVTKAPNAFFISFRSSARRIEWKLCS